MSRFGKQGVRCDWCGKIANNQNGEYTRPDGVSAGYIHQPDWDKEGPRDICEECAENPTNMPIKEGDRVRRKLANGKLSDRTGTVQTIYDGATHAMVWWESKHKRLAYRGTRDHIEEIKNLVRESVPSPEVAQVQE